MKISKMFGAMHQSFGQYLQNIYKISNIISNLMKENTYIKYIHKRDAHY